jgi:hypothetical protein
MTKTVAIVLLSMSCALCVQAQTNATEARDAKWIRRVQETPVSQLDPALPSVSFEKWLRVEAGADAEFHWEVNDCGEQTGTAADRDRDFPVCVEAQANMKDKRTIVVSVAVGTFKKRAFGKPKVYFAELITPRETIDIKQLSDMPDVLIRTHVTSPPEITK